ncbi:MAG TPA: tetratricopeptide repeat protein [Rubrobacter sp.]|nr:tetratricopeptide repeat protein [Rubrobacter sp.]
MPTGRAQTPNFPGIAADRRGDGRPTTWAGVASKGNLPLELSSFVGREREISQVRGVMGDARLLTLTGPGGCGKTRLALRVAADLAGSGERFGDGAWWVDLSSLSDPSLVPSTVASAFGVREAPDRTPTEALAAFLEAKSPLLVLDNCEHLVEACATLGDVLLRSCSGLKIMATSREPLGVAGEISWPVPPLALPDPNRRLNAQDLLRYSAVRLFVERARAASFGFSFTEENASVVAALCARLDGMPLAIELAASRVRVLSLRQILERLDDRFRLLRGSRTSVPRHKTLEATIDWSHELLSEEEKILFRRLSVFAGGWTLAAAEEVCADDGIAEDEILELLSSLVDKSLVLASQVEGSGEAHYRMLQTIQQYAAQRPGEPGDAEAVGRRHAEYFLSLAERAEPALAGPEQAAWMERLEEEHDNLRAALGWFEEKGEAERGLRLAAASLRFWWLHGHLSEGRTYLETLLDRPGAQVRDEVRAEALQVLGRMIYLHADYIDGGWEVARCRLEESLRIYRRLGNERGVADVRQSLGRVYPELGERRAAFTFLEESLEIERRLENGSGIARSLFNLGYARLLDGDLPSARSYFEEGLRIFRKLDDGFWINASLVHLGFIDCEEGELARARAKFIHMNEVLPLVQFPWGTTYTLEGFARLAAAEGQPVRALLLGGATAELRRTFGVAIGPTRRAGFRRSLKPAWQALGDEDGKAAWDKGRTMTLEEALALALEEPEKKPDRPPGSILSAREVEVLSLVAEGLSDAEVAKMLYISPRTVGNKLHGAYRKLGVGNRTAAVKKAAELGLIDWP